VRKAQDPEFKSLQRPTQSNGGLELRLNMKKVGDLRLDLVNEYSDVPGMDTYTQNELQKINKEQLIQMILSRHAQKQLLKENTIEEKRSLAIKGVVDDGTANDGAIQDVTDVTDVNENAADVASAISQALADTETATARFIYLGMYHIDILERMRKTALLVDNINAALLNSFGAELLERGTQHIARKNSNNSSANYAANMKLFAKKCDGLQDTQLICGGRIVVHTGLAEKVSLKKGYVCFEGKLCDDEEAPIQCLVMQPHPSYVTLGWNVKWVSEAQPATMDVIEVS